MNLFQRLRQSFAILFGREKFLGEEKLDVNLASVANQATTAVAAPPVSSGATTSPLPPIQAEADPPTLPVPARAVPVAPPEILARLPRLSASEVDRFDFGCIRVSDQGIVEVYNKWESDFAGVPQASAIGRNFFRELAPCTNNRLIFGRFKEGVAQDDLNTIVSYAFTYKMRPTLVRVHLYRDSATKTNWVLVQKHETNGGK